MSTLLDNLPEVKGVDNCIDEYNAAIIRRGQLDFKAGFDHQDDNPYDHGTPEHELWLRGWFEIVEANRD